MASPITLAGHLVGPNQPLFVIAGPDVIESAAHAIRHARRLKELTQKLGVPFAFKCSFDKANRTSITSFRGPGLVEGLKVLAQVKREVQVPILTDLHDLSQVSAVAEVADIIQVPAFLCRQTDLVVAVAKTGRGVNIKKGQFVAPKDIAHQARKAFDSGNPNVLVTERGATFGYNNLVVDMRGLPMMRELGHPVVFDVTHSLQLPGAGDGVTIGLAQYIAPLARAGVAAGVDGVFMEVHDDPSRAKSDAANALALAALEPLLRQLVAVDRIAKSDG